MPKLTVDGIEVEVPNGATVMQACEAAGVEVPRFCYHERLSIAGNCRMCLVEMEKAPKPVASCAMPAGDGMVIRTNTPAIRKARRGVMEFLLINHPLDCPICDQGGECDLQDQAVGYGFDRGRYRENKRAVKDKYLGPLVKTAMTRCIHCTRCIRFIAEVAGVPELGATGRGEHMEVGTYIEKALTSELSGNIIDLCPVGALTSKPYAYLARPWELRKTESVDVLDAVGSNIRIDARGGEALRILPRLNEDVNEEWLSDKSRFSVDGLKRRRLDRPYVRTNGILSEATWDEAFSAIVKKVEATLPAKMAAIAGDLVDAESVLVLKDIMTGLGVANLECRQDGAKIGGARASYLFNTTIAGIDQADALLIVGSDPRREAPVLNARIRRRYLTGKLTVAVIGPKGDLTYKAEALGNDMALLARIADGGHPFAATLKAAQKPMIIVGMGAVARSDGAAVLAQARRIAETCGAIAEGWNGFNLLHLAGGRVGALDLGFLPQEGGRDLNAILAGTAAGEIDFVYLLGADEIDMAKLEKAFVVYQGHHGDKGAARADVILPGAAYTEKNATYVNTEGRAQQARMAVYPPGDAREDWRILRALASRLGVTLEYDTLDRLRLRLAAAAPCFSAIGDIVPAGWEEFGKIGSLIAGPIRLPIDNFYRTNPISRASGTMDLCSAQFVEKCGLSEVGEATGTHG